MISQAAEYALRAVICLASNPAAAQTTARIADAAAIPSGYLAKIMQALVRAGIVTSRRGLNGGFVLGPDPRSMTLMDVVRAMDVSHRVCACPLNIPAHKNNLCALHRQLDLAAARAEEVLDQLTIQDVLSDESGSKPLGEPCSPIGEICSRTNLPCNKSCKELPHDRHDAA